MIQFIKKTGGGGSGSFPDWTQIGYNDVPSAIFSDFNYSKNIYDNWDNTQITLANKFLNNKKLTYMPLVDTSNATNFNNMFTGCSNLKAIPQLNTSNGTNVASMFKECISLETIPLLNTSSATTMANMFNGCSNLKAIPQLNTNSLTAANNMFNGCSNLETIPLLNTSSVNNMQGMFTDCSSLSNESLNNILNMCINSVITTSTNKTLKKIGLSETQAAICTTFSNYQDFLDAGWTTGY